MVQPERAAQAINQLVQLQGYQISFHHHLDHERLHGLGRDGGQIA